MYRFSWKHNFSFLWVKCQWVQLLTHMDSTCLLLLKTGKFSRVAIPITHSYQGCERWFLRIYPAYGITFILAVLIAVVVFHCGSLFSYKEQ